MLASQDNPVSLRQQLKEEAASKGFGSLYYAFTEGATGPESARMDGLRACQAGELAPQASSW